MAKMSANVSGFALGCAAGALLYRQFGMLCFTVPPILTVMTLPMKGTKDQA